MATFRGIILGRVGTMTAAATAQASKDRIERDWRKFFDYHTQGTLKPFYCGSESLESPYWRLLTYDLRRTARGWRRCKVEDRENFIIWANVEEVAANEIARNFDREIRVRGARLFFTANGFVGVGPYTIEAGDSVCILAGGPLPYVLRPVLHAARLNTFELVGSCYVHGVMDGQAVHGLGEDEPPLPDLDLPKTEWHDIHLV